MSKYQMYLKLYPETCFEHSEDTSKDNKVVGRIIRDYTSMYGCYLINPEDYTDAFFVTNYYISPVNVKNTISGYINIDDYLEEADREPKKAKVIFQPMGEKKDVTLIAKTDQIMLVYSNNLISILPVDKEKYDVKPYAKDSSYYSDMFIKESLKEQVQENLAVIRVNKEIDISSKQKQKKKGKKE